MWVIEVNGYVIARAEKASDLDEVFAALTNLGGCRRFHDPNGMERYMVCNMVISFFEVARGEILEGD